MKKITILIPVYNEEEVLDQLRGRLNKVLDPLDRYQFEILFVNDGSKDRTLEIIKGFAAEDLRISYINLSRNYGKEIAMIAGLDYATGDAVVIMDADLQNPPELIPQMVAYWEEGYDDVYAKKRNRGDESWLRKYTSQTFYKCLQKLSAIQIQENTGDFRLLDRRCVEAVKQFRESQRYTKGMFTLIGFKKKEILFDCEPRAAGKSKWNYLKLCDLAVDGITCFSIIPLRFSSLLGACISLFAFVYMIFIIFKTILYGESVQGYPSLIVIILFLGGIQLLSLGIIGEYIGRIFNEAKRRPLYFVDEYNGKKIY